MRLVHAWQALLSMETQYVLRIRKKDELILKQNLNFGFYNFKKIISRLIYEQDYWWPWRNSAD
jgi:hypothetical protein